MALGAPLTYHFALCPFGAAETLAVYCPFVVRRNQRVLHQLRRLRQGGEDEQSASDERVRGALKNRLPSEVRCRLLLPSGCRGSGLQAGSLAGRNQHLQRLTAQTPWVLQVNLPKNVMPDLLEAASRKGTAQQPKEGTQAPAKGDGRQRNPIFNQQEQLLRHDGTTLPNGECSRQAPRLRCSVCQLAAFNRAIPNNIGAACTGRPGRCPTPLPARPPLPAAGKPIVPEQPADIFIQELNAGDTGAFAARATNLLKRTPKQAQSTLTQAFAASLASATATSAQQAALTTAQAAAETFSLSGGSVSVASAFALVGGWAGGRVGGWAGGRVGGWVVRGN